MKLNLRSKFTLATVLVLALTFSILLALFFYFSLASNTNINDRTALASNAEITAPVENEPESKLIQSLVIAGSAIVLLIIGGVSSYKISGKLVHPIDQLTKQTRQLKRALPPAEERITSSDEIGNLAKAIYAIAGDSELQSRSIQYLAYKDPLTKLSNRNSFKICLEDSIVDTASRRQKLAMLYLDLDDFKKINHTHGHEYGDRVLRAIATRLSTCVEEACEQKNYRVPMIGRLGDDEFATLITGKLDSSEIAKISESVLNELSQPIEIDNDTVQLSASIGIAFYPTDALRVSDVFNRSNIAMYAGKSSGKGTYQFFDESMDNSDEVA